MTRILRLLLIAAVAWPLSHPAAAQKVIPPKQKTETTVKAEKAVAEACQELIVERSALDKQKPIAKMAVKRNASKLKSNRATQTKTIYETTNATSRYAPVYGWYFDYGTTTQMIYPAADLGLSSGDVIKALTFYSNSDGVGSQIGSTTVTVSVGTTASTTLTQTYNAMSTVHAGLTQVYSGVLSSSSNGSEMTITFSGNGYTYNPVNGGNNLIIEFKASSGGDDSADTYWVGVNAETNSIACCYGSSNSMSGSTVTSFLPKMTITYEPLPSDPYYATLTGDGAFGEITKGTSETATFTVSNRGTEAFTPQLAITQTETAFSISGDMTTPLASGDSRNFVLTFSPDKVKEYTGTLTLSAPQGDGAISATVALSGKGVNDVTVADGSDGSTTTTNDYVPVYGYYFENTNTNDQMIYPASMLSGIDGKKIKSITFYAPNGIKFSNPNGTYGTGDLKVTIGTTTDSNFPTSPSKKDITNPKSKTITPEYGATKMTITFDEAFEYNQSMGNLIIDTQVAEAGQYGSGTNWVGISTGDYPSIYRGGSGSYIRQQFLPKITFELEAGVSIDKTSLDFGNVEVNTTSVAQIVTISNSGDEDADLSWSFTNGKFATTATATSVPAGGQVEIPVTFAPTVVGAQTGTLTINAGDEAFNVALSGNALVAYAATLEPQTVDFGAVAMYNTQTATVTLTNTGANAITPTITQPSEPFSVTGDQTALASGKTRTYTITFAPTAEDTYSGEFTIADADHSISFTVTLTGQGAPLNPVTANSPVEFGSVDLNTTKTATVTFSNPNNVPVTVSLSTAEPFAVASSTLTVPANGSQSVTLSFVPTAAISYNGTLTASVNGVNTIVVLRGAGHTEGPEAIRDKAFFDGITYTWSDSEGSHTSKLSDIATKPEQIIAMLKEVYTNKSIPGNFKRGCTAYGNFTESFSDVSYPAIGTIEWVGPSDGYLNDLTNYAWTDTYGWGISTSKDVIFNEYNGYSSSNPIYYAHFDQTEYKPENEGVTLLLVETTDDYDQDTFTYPTTTGAQYLKDIVAGTIKSVRVVTQSKRTGTDFDRGTLFNVNCDKMNKFYFLAKGQLRMPYSAMKAYHGSSSSSYIPSANFSPYPLYIYSENYFGYGTIDGYADYYNAEPFYQMFEEFSPVNLNTGSNVDDLYNSLVNMQSFNVIHDCITIPFATSSSEGDVHHGHQFMLYGVQSGAADCQDVRDMMFFVPDYRMMNWDGRDNTIVPYTNYNQSYAPKMGLYVIRQDEVHEEAKTDTYYKLKLTWDSNMDEFLPGEQQEYQLYQVITDEFGVSKWVPVYKRNAQGQYWNPTTNTWQADTTGAEPVVLTLNPNDSKTYSEVYELREQSSRYVTYAIRGCDTGHFLSLQMSNEQSFLIEGLDPAEMAMLSSATVYSRFEAQDVRNCYSNKLQLKSSPQTIKASYLPDGSTMTINRTHRVMQNNQSVEVTEPVATLTINTSSKKFTVSGSVLDANVENLFPKGSNDGLVAGYHANNLTNNQIDYTTTTVGGVEYINFDISLWDNFVADVSNNEHPGLYIYQLRFNTAESFTGLNGQTTDAYSNYFPVFVYKTDSQINKPLTLEQVDGDTGCSDDYKPGDVEFGAHVTLSSKTEILRYDAYRWEAGKPRSIVIDGGETDADEEDADPNGIAGNQGGSYSITMNAIGSADYYVGDPVSVTTAEPWNWATFVDYYPAKNPNAIAYVYAPVVELFTRGYQEGSTDKERTDYNTYGGPLKEIALGKLHFNVMSPDATLNPLMSTYSWEVDGKKYAYYNIKLDIDKKKVPEGYQIYKVRAWREIPETLQGEEYQALANTRMGARVLFEDIIYPDCDASENHQVLGGERKDVIVIGADQTSHTYTSYTGTFGARKLRTEGPSETGVIDELPYKFIVRIYFTKQDNLQTTQNGVPGQKAGNPVLNEDAKFYVAEYEIEDAFDSTNVPTAIQTLNARQVVSEKYYNPAGIESDTPFKGVNIVVTRYSDGSTTTTKILK